MATETQTLDARASHRRSILVTTVATLLGVVAGVVSSAVAAGPTDPTGAAIVSAFMLADLGVLRLLGVDVTDFSAKDNLYVFFMTFTLWFITWSILLTSQTVF